MAAPGPSNLVARHVIDDLVDFSGETSMPKYMKFFFDQQIAETHRFINRMPDEAGSARNCIAYLTALIAELEAMGDQEDAKEKIATKESHMEIMEAATFMFFDYGFSVCAINGCKIMVAFSPRKIFVLGLRLANASRSDSLWNCLFVWLSFSALLIYPLAASNVGNGSLWFFLAVCRLCQYGCGVLEMVYTWLPPEFPVMAPFFLLDKLAEVADSPRLQDKMKWVFSRARSDDEFFIGLMCDLCFGLRMSLHKNRRLITELEALGQRVDALRSLDCLREIVAHDSGTLGVLEQLLDRAHVGIRLKNGYVAEMEQSE
ncbi:hypothetical protein Tco_0337746 [Tanacetum coccineum]